MVSVAGGAAYTLQRLGAYSPHHNQHGSLSPWEPAARASYGPAREEDEEEKERTWLPPSPSTGTAQRWALLASQLGSPRGWRSAAGFSACVHTGAG